MIIYRAAKCRSCGRVVNASGKNMREVRADAILRHSLLYLPNVDKTNSTCNKPTFDLVPNEPVF